jgi:hypothetical protein
VLMVLLLNAGYVEVTEATTCEMVIVLVRVAVEVRVVVDVNEEVCAAARRGRRRTEVSFVRCIVWNMLAAQVRSFEMGCIRFLRRQIGVIL